MSQQPYVSIRDLRFRYPGSPDDVLRIPTLTISGRGAIALTGPSGAGKSTLVELLAGTLREPYEGSVQVLGTELKALTRDADRQRHVRRVGLIPQDYSLLPGMTVEGILRQDLADAEVPKAEHTQRIEWALAQVDLTVFAQRQSERLSGGQRQRVAIARMLARDVDLVIADEPTANLDPEQVGETVHLLRRLAGRVPVIVVTHDARVAEQCDRTIVLQAMAPTAPADASPAGATHAIPRGVSLHVRSSLLLAALIVTLVVLGSGGASLAWHIAGSSRSGPSHTTTGGVPTHYTAADIIKDFTSNGLPVGQVIYSMSLNNFLDGWTYDDAHNHSEGEVTTRPQSSVFFRDPTVCAGPCDTGGDTFLAVYASTTDAQSSLAQVKSWTEYVNNCSCGPFSMPNDDIQRGRCLLITYEPRTNGYAQLEDKYCV